MAPGSLFLASSMHCAHAVLTHSSLHCRHPLIHLHSITSHHITSQHNTSCQVTSRHVTSRHTRSYLIIMLSVAYLRLHHYKCCHRGACR